jgi:hypothetical protein
LWFLPSDPRGTFTPERAGMPGVHEKGGPKAALSAESKS